ncbi:putative membrane protein [Lysobacter enzymogenes]|jgi:hypothetical protein|uniref:hypothetical protein n=1 Tax=Lysobacter enzymogenes TaxID=69 RepID=UPI00089485ED|nr:hypothetical protein [Lysobacter enzymogenes]SDX87726.1 hypothetical protein SAMN05421681_108281 [Lysobacter enzymogenes]
MRKLPTALLAAALLAGLPLLAQAESQYTTGTASPITATARLDFQITVPKILFLRVGAGADYTNTATINQISFAVPAANVGNGAAVAATAASGDLGNGAVTAKLVGNNGTITLSSSTVGALGNGSGDSISYSQIQTTTATNTTATALNAPALADGAVTSTTVAPGAGSKVVNLDAKWTYAYLNGAVVAPGTYGGVNANNSRVTYTASMP